jgi:hypothetical protein
MVTEAFCLAWSLLVFSTVGLGWLTWTLLAMAIPRPRGSKR